ncbi:MAG TPA: dienelactone hydrolase family protein [Candidatus Methylomirabilis sp.]|nr:dienelactone hydrolase family protein [Candidatus Methylomirabilis sp.]
MTSVIRLVATVLLAMPFLGCAAMSTRTEVTFPNVTPGAPLEISAVLVRPAGQGPFPAVVQFHGCAGVSNQSYLWAAWLAERGYVALVVDSFGPRAVNADCRGGEDEPPITARFDDGIGALRYLQSLPFVCLDRVAAIGWSQGGVYAIAMINGPSLERARARGVDLPAVGFAAAVGIYPGGCPSLAKELVIRPLLVLIGASDDWTRAEKCEEMVTAMRARGADASIVIYPGAYHYFDVIGQPLTVLPDVENALKSGGYGATVGYQPAAARDAHQQVEAFLAQHLEGAAPAP